MSAIGKPLHLRLFLEGIEVPVVSAQVSVGINAPAAAAIQMIPSDRSLELMPRTMVHLFYLDNAVAQVTKGKEISNEVERVLRDYKLLFAGEMIAYQYHQTPQSRGIVLQCVDFSSYWDSAHATAIEYGPGGNWADHTGSVSGSNTSLMDDIVNHQQEVIMSWLHQKPRTPGLNTVDGLAGGIIRILEAMGGLPGHEKGVNDFFTLAELRCKILQQIVAEEKDNTARTLFNSQVMDEWIRTGLQNIGQQVTFRDIIKMLFRYIHYEMVPCPVAKFAAARQGTVTEEVVQASVAKMPEGVAAASSFRQKATDLQGNIDRGTSLDNWKDVLQDAKKKVEAARDKFSAAQKKRKTEDLHLSGTLSQISFILTEVERLITNKGEWADTKTLIELLNGAAQYIQNTGGSKALTRTTSTAVADRLQTQIMRPDCFFAPPPVCNVVFPEQYVSLQFERNYMGEVTRVLTLVKDTLVGAEKILSARVLAPYFKQMTRELAQEVDERSYRILMDHELHTGIVPREEWLPNTARTAKEKERSNREETVNALFGWVRRVALFNFFKYRFANRSCAVAGRFTPNLVCGFPAVVIRAPFYPEERFLADVTPEQRLHYLLENAATLGAPTHLVGMIGSLAHNIDQQGGTTNFQMHHVRHHSGSDDEFLSKVKGFRKVPREIQVTLNYKDIAASKDTNREKLLKYLVDLTPQAAKSIVQARVKKVTKVDVMPSHFVPLESVRTRTEKTVTEKPPPAGCVYVGRDEERRLVPAFGAKISVKGEGPLGQGSVIGIEVTDHNFSYHKKAAKLDVAPSHVTPGSVPAKKVDRTERAFNEVVVTVSQEIKVDQDIPTEEILRPRSWFSKKYANDLIGREIYQPFFGCNSVIDELRVQLGDEIIEDTDFAGGDAEGSTTALDLVKYVDQVKVDLSKVYQHSIERALNLLAYTYGLVKKGNKDVENFIQQFTYRPVATQEDVLGSLNLEFEVAANGKATPIQGPGVRVGFHSTAVHQQLVNSSVRLAGLVEDISTQLPRVSGSGLSSLPPSYDVRQAKWKRVMAYYEELLRSRAFRG
jgi:hypothetical protein